MRRKYMISYNKTGLLMSGYFHFVLFLCFHTSIFGQLNLDFNDGNINRVLWQGNINHFIINKDGQLQLNAPTAGESAIFTKYKTPPDSIKADLYFKMQFAPSNDNFSKIYLFTDNVIESQANGYYLRLGENGSNDAIQVYKLNKGVPQLLGSGRMTAISGDPADARVRFNIYKNGLWVMMTDYEGNTLYEDDLEFSDPTYALKDSVFFGIYCKYTATRIDKFLFDDIAIKTIEKDSTAPVVLKAEVLSESVLALSFSESIDETSARNINAYTIDNGLGNPSQVIYSRLTPNVVQLVYSSAKILSGVQYRLTISGIKDKSNNQKTHTIPFNYAVKPSKGDLLITEVLTDPYTGGEDFVELYNNSTKFIKLDSILISNLQKNETKVISTPLILLPGKYVAISKNTDFLKTTYNTPDTASFVTGTLPSLNVDGANITLSSMVGNQSTTIDSFDYSDKFHFELIDNTKGVSLEKIKITGPSNDRNNWHSASSQVKYATPGYKNSNDIKEGNVSSEFGIIADKKVFTPNGDGTDDFLLLNYKTDKPGYLATLRVFDAEGFPKSYISNNLLLGTEGTIKWNGIDGEGNILSIGMYIIYARLFHPDGDIKEYKLVVVVANPF
ncbi:MAG: lamin tail domain-containing protein [Saprospiraceae bacterium]